jgi:hypothetical protein
MQGDALRGDDRTPRRSGGLFEASHKVSCRANAGEIEAVAAADVAAADLTQMERHSKADLLDAFGAEGGA